jgi:hypothetical protein
MTLRLLLASALVACSFTACESPYKKKEQEDRKPLKDQSHDQNFQAFIGRLRTAVAKQDRMVLASLMTPDFGYRWDPAPAGETVFDYWDQLNLWPQLDLVLREQFVPNDLYMVAPAQVVSDPNYSGYRAGMRIIQGSWKFAYFVPGEGAVAQ